MIDAKLGTLVAGITLYLSDYFRDRQDFGMRVFYGEAFSLALLSRTGQLDSDLETKLNCTFDHKDRTDSQYHWEFNNYGMLEAGRLSFPLTFKHTPCTNWTLLRSNVRIRANVDVKAGKIEAKDKLKRMQKPSGLILDDLGVKSFQYHCFSAAMIYEIYQKTQDEFFLDSFTRAVSFIRHFILPSGDTLYVGRGQQQSFGYASLVYILAASFALTEDPNILGDLVKVTNYLVSHTRPDGSLPLVFGGGEEPLPHSDAPHRDARYLGWYAYNNYFDYLPFTGLFLQKAIEVLGSAPDIVPLFPSQKSYRDADFLKVVTGETVAVVSRPGGYWTNDLPIPYIHSGGRSRMPCYGGEQFGGSIYSMDGIPLPARGSFFMRWRLRSFFLGNTLVVVSPTGILLRRFIFGERRIEINNKVFSPFRLRDRYLLLNEAPSIRSEFPLHRTGTEYSASGALTAYEAERIGNITFEFPK